MKYLRKNRFLCTIIALLLLLSACNTNQDAKISPAPTVTTSSPLSSGSETPSPIKSSNTSEVDANSTTLNPASESTSKTENKTSNLYVHFIDVGQGDSILIQASEKNVLIDGGPRAAGRTVVDYLNNLGITELDIVIGTHPHEDHIGGLISVLQDITVKEVIDPAIAHTTKTFEEYLTLIDNKNIKFTEGRAGTSRKLGAGIKLDILYPSSPSDSDLNNASIVTKISFDQISFLFVGDIETKSEQEILQKNANLKSTILKIGHHGSRTSTSSEFLKAVAPKAAIIMCGKDNSYGHPHDEILALLSESKVDIYRTDTQGSVIINSDGQRYEVNIKEPYQYVPPKVPEPTPTPTRIQSSGQYVGSKSSDKYHYPDCRYVEQIKPNNLIWFEDEAIAASMGYTTCKVCNPPGAVIKTPEPKQSPQNDITVYITKTGAKYHTSGCKYLSKSKIPISLKSAKASGYTPCSVCGPPR